MRSLLTDVFDASDRPAVEIRCQTSSDPAVVSEIALECARAGFVRVAVDAVELPTCGVQVLSRSLADVSRAVLVVGTTEAADAIVRPERTLLRMREFDPVAFTLARRSGVRALVSARAVHLDAIYAAVSAAGVSDAEEWVIAEMSGDPGDLSVIGRLKQARRVKVWDDVVSRRLLSEHPCYAYLCTPTDCHMRRTSLPRRLTIGPDLSVSPYSLPSEYWLGVLEDTGDLARILDGAHANPSWARFQALVRQAFHGFITVAGAELVSVNAVLRATETAMRC